MSPDDISRVQGVAGVRQDNAAQVRVEVQSAPPAAPPKPLEAAASAAAPEVNLAAPATTDLRTAPVDAERVAEIRDAIQQGNYPLVPAKIADAIIAAPMLLSSEA